MHIGEFAAHETLLWCAQCESIRVYASEDLLKLVPERCKLGYDVIVYVSKALFLRHRNHREIVEELEARNIRISPSEIDYLGKKFIIYLALAHRQCAGRIKGKMALNGGYILHLDGTIEEKSPLLMVGVDGIMEIVLGSVKLPSEKAEKIIPFLEELKALFGEPTALVHDMGAGILRAVEKVFPGIPDFICHFHFLRDIGKDLFGQEYDTIRKHLRKHGITTKLHYRAKRLRRVIDANPPWIDTFHNSIQSENFSDTAIELIWEQDRKEHQKQDLNGYH